MPLDHPTDSRTQKADAADLLRMDDDGGGRSEAAAWSPTAPGGCVGGAGWGVPSGTIPGEREPGPQTRFAGSTTGTRILSDWPMSAATIADRQREGGGAPSQRRRASAESGWRRTWRTVRGLIIPAPSTLTPAPRSVGVEGQATVAP
jgi:hypothetical protein